MAKATITKLTPSGGESDKVEVMFNPKELTFSRTNSWKQDDSPKANLPNTEFSSGGATTLKMQLYFDTYKDARSAKPPGGNGSAPKPEDVREKYTHKLVGMMNVDKDWKHPKTKKGRPPNVRFQWGKLAFEAVITSINQRFTLFVGTDDGIPVRAVLDVTFSEVKDSVYKPPQNPTSAGVGGERLWTVRDGDTLPWIAFTEYNDAKMWRAIADANRLTQLRRLRPGTILVIPSV